MCITVSARVRAIKGGMAADIGVQKHHTSHFNLPSIQCHFQHRVRRWSQMPMRLASSKVHAQPGSRREQLTLADFGAVAPMPGRLIVEEHDQLAARHLRNGSRHRSFTLKTVHKTTAVLPGTCASGRIQPCRVTPWS